ncbi:CxC2 domain-containing protein [Mycena sanguinolenta]|uniref:CxC2 domain-containing protein n=1 Tax=Mycena sanguinolenta TaxID=230812 RepID=A0A8H6X8C8_9AGAR|nr:CxC2 domain-containing protein [Mycena sanguinolenta]
MKRPQAVGDLQLGERYINMHYMFLCSVAGTDLFRFFVSYDFACQWQLNLWGRMAKYKDATLTLDGEGRFFAFLVPKFHLPAHIEACNLKYSFRLTRDVGQTDDEAPERFRRDTIDDHFNDWNHKKIIALGYTLRRKIEATVPEMVKTRRALQDMNESMAPEVLAKWVAMADRWEENIANPNPFETIRKDQHVAQVRPELAAEAAEREELGMEDEGGGEGGHAHNGAHRDGLAAMSLQLEDRHCGKILPSASQCSGARDDETRARQAGGRAIPGLPVSGTALWLPSAIAREAVPGKREVFVQKTVFKHEYRLRVGQASEALHEIRRLLLVRTHLYKSKDTHSRGVRANMRSNDKIAALNEQIKRAAATYRAAHQTLESLGRKVGQNKWSWSLHELKEDDVRGLSSSPIPRPGAEGQGGQEEEEEGEER